MFPRFPPRATFVTDTNVSPFSPARNICYGHKCFPIFPRAQHLLRTQMFPRFPPRAAFVADTNVSPFSPARNICCGHKFLCPGHKKMFLILFRNILCPQQMFPSLHSPRNIMSSNVSATMCPRLPVLYVFKYVLNWLTDVTSLSSGGTQLIP